MAKNKRYQKATIKALVEYLEHYGLSVYGAYMHNGVQSHGCMDYDVDQIMERIKHIENGTLETNYDD